MWGLPPKPRLQERYQYVGFISSGTYGRVYKAIGVGDNGASGSGEGSRVYAIKKFKPERENELIYTGISQSAIREMSLCAELNHPNVIRHIETILQDHGIHMVFEYYEHDLLQVVHHHSQLAATTRDTTTTPNSSTSRSPPPCASWAIPPHTIKSILYQLLLGTHHLHTSHILHRDLKPANIMLSSAGLLSIGDLGLARAFLAPPAPLYTGDKVVVTIWYRAPELLLGARHYTPAVDLWAVGCIFAELLCLRPMFKGEEAKMERKSVVPWQKSQVSRILEVLGTRGFEMGWTGIKAYPEWNNYSALAHGSAGAKYRAIGANGGGGGGASKAGGGDGGGSIPAGLESWYNTTLANAGYNLSPTTSPGASGLALLAGLLTTDPTTRLTAAQALAHPYFRDITEAQKSSCFDGTVGSEGAVLKQSSGQTQTRPRIRYPKRKITQDEESKALPGGAKRAAPPLEEASGPSRGSGAQQGVGQAGTNGTARPSKRVREV